MLRLVLMSFLSLDGVYQGPGAPSEDHTDGFERGGWLVPFVDAVFEETATQWTASATGFLFGRRTYEAFSSVWPSVTDPADSNAARLNTLPKFVVTSKQVDMSWGPVTAIGEDVAARLIALKRDRVGELQIHGSGRLGRSLLATGLVDELRLAIAPVVVGQGRKLFADTGHATTGVYKRGETNVRAAMPENN